MNKEVLILSDSERFPTPFGLVPSDQTLIELLKPGTPLGAVLVKVTEAELKKREGARELKSQQVLMEDNRRAIKRLINNQIGWIEICKDTALYEGIDPWFLVYHYLTAMYISMITCEEWQGRDQSIKYFASTGAAVLKHSKDGRMQNTILPWVDINLYRERGMFLYSRFPEYRVSNSVIAGTIGRYLRTRTTTLQAVVNNCHNSLAVAKNKRKATRSPQPLKRKFKCKYCGVYAWAELTGGPQQFKCKRKACKKAYDRELKEEGSAKEKKENSAYQKDVQPSNSKDCSD